jgi:hypothetical protein
MVRLTRAPVAYSRSACTRLSLLSCSASGGRCRISARGREGIASLEEDVTERYTARQNSVWSSLSCRYSLFVTTPTLALLGLSGAHGEYHEPRPRNVAWDEGRKRMRLGATDTGSNDVDGMDVMLCSCVYIIILFILTLNYFFISF